MDNLKGGSNPPGTSMKKLTVIFLLLMTCNIKCQASEGIWEYVDNIPTEAVVAPSIKEVEIEPEQPLCREVKIDNHNGMKTWMPYTLFSKSSQQYELQQYAETDSLGFRCIAGRYLVAVGSAAKVSIGQYVDIVLENGEVIPCIIGDSKADSDTYADNLTTKGSGCVCEFIVDTDILAKRIKKSGDVSSIDESYDSPVDKIIVYEKVNFFGGEDDL